MRHLVFVGADVFHFLGLQWKVVHCVRYYTDSVSILMFDCPFSVCVTVFKRACVLRSM